jgi:hypothetical protein
MVGGVEDAPGYRSASQDALRRVSGGVRQGVVVGGGTPLRGRRGVIVIVLVFSLRVELMGFARWPGWLSCSREVGG